MAVLSTLRSFYDTEDYELNTETLTQNEEIIEDNNGFVEEDIIKEDNVYKDEDIIDEIEDKFIEGKDELEEDIISDEQVDCVQEEESIYENEDVTEEVTEIEADGGIWRNW
jgi:hypothetical protein